MITRTFHIITPRSFKERLIGTPLKGSCLAFKGRLPKISGAGAARLAQAVAIEAGARGCHNSRRRRKAEQSWRLQPQDRVVSASFAPPCACACMDLGLGPGPLDPGPWARSRPLGPGPGPLWPCIGHVRICFQVFVYRTLCDKSKDLGSSV